MIGPSAGRQLGCGAFPMRFGQRFKPSRSPFFASCGLPACAAPRGQVTSNEKRRLAITARLRSSDRFRIPVHWLHAVMRAESGGDANSVSGKAPSASCKSCRRPTPNCARYGLGPDPSIRATIFWPAPPTSRDARPIWRAGFLAAYNAGPGRYEDFLRGHPLPAETTDYVARIAPALTRPNLRGAFALSENCSSPIFRLTRPQGHDHQRPGQGSRRHEEQRDRHVALSFRRSQTTKLFAADSQPTAAPMLRRCALSRAATYSRSRAQELPMNQLSISRILAHALAPLARGLQRERQRPSYWQDKRDSLRLCPAVGLLLRINAFYRLPFSPAAFPFPQAPRTVSQIFTSSALAMSGDDDIHIRPGRIRSTRPGRGKVSCRRPGGDTEGRWLIVRARAARAAAPSAAAGPRVSRRCGD